MTTSNEKSTFKKIEVEGIAMYASVHCPKKAYTEGESPAYSLDLIVDEANAKKLTDEGLKPAKTVVDEDTKKPKEYAEHPGLKVFRLQRKTDKRDGTKRTPLTVVDSDTNALPPTILVGNGSKVRVMVNPYTMTIKGREITGSVLLGVQVLELVAYTGTGGSTETGFSKTSGFKVGSSTGSTGNTSSQEKRTTTQSEDENSNPFTN